MKIWHCRNRVNSIIWIMYSVRAFQYYCGYGHNYIWGIIRKQRVGRAKLSVWVFCFFQVESTVEIR